MNASAALKGVGFASCLLTGWNEAASAAQLVWSTFLGGSGADYVYAVATDSHGDIYLAGSTASADFPTTPGAFMRTFKSANDVVVVKLRGDGATLVWSTYLAGSGSEDARAIAVDAAGNVYVAGNTSSTDFPVTAGAHRVAHAGGISDGFVAKIAPAGDRLVWCTYLGGGWDDYPRALAVDGSRNVVVAGSTNSLDYPTTLGVVMPVRTPSIIDGADGFITKLASAGSGLVWSTYFGSSGGTDNIFGLALDGSGRPTVVGWTLSPTFPVTPGAYDVTFDYRREGYVTRLNATVSSYVYSTFIGGGGHDECLAVALDGSGAALVSGKTESANFPTTAGAAQRTFGGGSSDAFALELSPNGSALDFSTYLGGAGADLGCAASITGDGLAVFTGSTDSGNYPVSGDALIGSSQGGNDALVSSLLSAGSLGYSTYLGSSGDDQGKAAALVSGGLVVVAGQTSSSAFPTSANAWDGSYGGGTDGFVSLFDLGGGTVGVGDPLTPVTASLAPAQPNPHADHATIRFALSASAPVRLVIHDLQGRLVRTLADEVLESGAHRRVWDGRDADGAPAPPGIYFVELRLARVVETQRIVRLR